MLTKEEFLKGIEGNTIAYDQDSPNTILTLRLLYRMNTVFGRAVEFYIQKENSVDLSETILFLQSLGHFEIKTTDLDLIKIYKEEGCSLGFGKQYIVVSKTEDGKIGLGMF